MLDSLERLLRVQELDLEIRSLEEEARALAPRVEQHDREIARRAEILKKLEAEAASPAAKRRVLESDLKEAEARVERAKRQQTQVRTAKELDAANHDLQGAEARVSTLEEEILALLDQEEAAAREFNTKREAAARIDARAKEERNRLATALDEKRSLAKDLREDRIVALNRLEDDLRDTYERLLKLHHGPPAVVDLRGTACGGCGAVQVPQTVARIRQGTELITCSNCYRYIYARSGV